MRTVVAGHLCLDVIPAIASPAPLEPGALVEAGPVAFSPGGAVANVGLSLARLGFAPILVGRVGDDPFGAILRGELEGVGPQVTAGVAVMPGGSTSYSVVISPPGRDRSFLHHPGCNDVVEAADLALPRWADADLLHFGYPPLMRGIYGDGGRGLAEGFAALRGAGVTVSLDMAMPDLAGASGRVDWLAFLGRVLPEVDLFLPSWEEICFMLESDRPRGAPEPQRLARLAQRLLDAGAALVGLKLGDDGLYLRTAGPERLARFGRAGLPAGWASRELLSPNYRVAVRGTTGAGDATIAGLLAALGQGLGIEEAASMASAVGASSVEGVDAASGVRPWQETRARRRGWQRAGFEADGWRRDGATGVMLGPNDRGGMT